MSSNDNRNDTPKKDVNCEHTARLRVVKTEDIELYKKDSRNPVRLQKKPIKKVVHSEIKPKVQTTDIKNTTESKKTAVTQRIKKVNPEAAKQKNQLKDIENINLKSGKNKLKKSENSKKKIRREAEHIREKKENKPKIEEKSPLLVRAKKLSENIKTRKAYEEKIKKEESSKSGKLSYRAKYGILIAVVIVFFVSAYQFVKVRDIDFSKLKTEISANANKKEFDIGDDAKLRKLYNIQAQDIENYILIAPKSNMNASEILIVKCNPKNADSVMKSIQARIDSQSNSFKNYAPSEYKIISSHELKQKGDYIIYISWPDVSKIESMINKAYK